MVLAISGMALAVIFSIGTKAGDTGFGLGRRAMVASDSDIAISDLRSILRSIALRPSAAFQVATDQPVVGTSGRLEAEVVMERANLCAPVGWAGRMTLVIEMKQARSQLVCEAAGRKNVLIDLGPGTGSFSFSRDRRFWTSAYSNAPTNTQGVVPLASETVWIRFVSPVSGDVIEEASSGPPEPWVRVGRDF